MAISRRHGGGRVFDAVAARTGSDGLGAYRVLLMHAIAAVWRPCDGAEARREKTAMRLRISLNQVRSGAGVGEPRRGGVADAYKWMMKISRRALAENVGAAIHHRLGGLIRGRQTTTPSRQAWRH